VHDRRCTQFAERLLNIVSCRLTGALYKLKFLVLRIGWLF